MATILNVAPNTTVTTVWGNSVADELNLRVLKLAGGTMTGDLTLRNADPTAANHAARKSYVDAAAAKQVANTGDTMTGTLVINELDSSLCLLLRSQQTGAGGSFVNTPYMAWYNNSQTTRFAYIQATSAYLHIVCDHGDINLNSGGGQVRSSDAIYASGASRFSGGSISIVGTSGNAFSSLYGNGSSVDSLGIRYGYVGAVNPGHLHVRSEITNGHVYFGAHGYMLFHTGVPPSASSGSLGPYERMRIDPSGTVLVGKTSGGITTEGVALYANGTIYSTRGAASGSPLYLDFQNGVDGNFYATFMRNGTVVGRIEQEGTTGSKFVSGSDRRMKNILGPITDAIERVKALKPYRVSWKADPSRGETDAFIADEVQDIVPEAVSGLPNAVAPAPEDPDDPTALPEGTPIYQGMAYEKLVTVAIAALQNVIGRVEALEAS